MFFGGDIMANRLNYDFVVDNLNGFSSVKSSLNL